MINRTQEEIMQNWPKEWNIPLVSIRCAAFNHENYISDALDGFLIQETNFPFEVIVHDDASTDRTATIIKEYEKKYPRIIKPIYETENQYSKHDGSLRNIITAACKGKYFALCEGDDYWTDPNKLQRQFDQLEQNPLYAAVAENGIVLFTHSGEKKLFSNEPERDISLDELLIRRRFPTASVMYRKQLNVYMANYPFTVDTIMWGILSQHGLIHYNPIVSSVYRRGCGITESNKIAWAYYSNKFNHQINKIFPISKHVKKIREQDHYINLKNGWCEAYNKKKFRHIIQLLFLMLWWSPKLFFIDFTHFLGRRLLCSLKKSKH